MKFTNNPYLELLRLTTEVGVYEYTNLTKFQVLTLCASWKLDFNVIEKSVEGPISATEVHIDLPLYYASKKENQVNSMNIGEEIVYVTPAVPRQQAMKITRENIIQAAQWCGATEIRVPSGPERWGFNVGTQTANIGDVIVRGLDGDFEVMYQETFFKKYDRV